MMFVIQVWKGENAMSVLLALGIVIILIIIGFLWGSIDVKKYKRDYKFESKDFINRFETDAWTLR